MKHKTWFRLVLKAIGILLIGMSLPAVAGLTMWIVRQAAFGGSPWTVFTPPGSTPVTGWLGPIADLMLSIVPQFAQFAFGLYLVLGGEWIVNKVVPSNRPYCPECGYDLSKSHRETCPECGVALPADLLSRADDAAPATDQET